MCILFVINSDCTLLLHAMIVFLSHEAIKELMIQGICGDDMM